MASLENVRVACAVARFTIFTKLEMRIYFFDLRLRTIQKNLNLILLTIFLGRTDSLGLKRETDGGK